MSVSKVPVLSSDGGLSRYLSEIRKFPMLTQEEEYTLGTKWRENEDREAAPPEVQGRHPRGPRLRARRRSAHLDPGGGS